MAWHFIPFFILKDSIVLCTLSVWFSTAVNGSFSTNLNYLVRDYIKIVCMTTWEILKMGQLQNFKKNNNKKTKKPTTNKDNSFHSNCLALQCQGCYFTLLWFALSQLNTVNHKCFKRCIITVLWPPLLQKSWGFL